MQPNHHELPESLRRLREEYQAPRPPAGYLDALADRVAEPSPPVVRVRRLWPRLAAAAAVLIMLVAGWWAMNGVPVTEEAPLTNLKMEAVESNYAPEIDDDFLLSVVLLEAEEFVLPEEYLLEEEDELYFLDMELF